MFIHPTSKGFLAPDSNCAMPKAIVPNENFSEEDKTDSEPEEESACDPFMRILEEEELYYDEFLDFYCGQHVHDT